MILTPGDGNIHVKVGTVIAQEYRIEEKVEGKTVTRSCFIEAKEGENFVVSVEAPNASACCVVELFIDGIDVDSASVCDDRRFKVDFEGYREESNDTREVLKAFNFGKMITTDKGLAKKLTSIEMDEACSIRVEITRMIRKGPIKHPSSSAPTKRSIAVSAVHEDSKLAMLGVQAMPGALLIQEARGRCRCKMMPDPNAVKDVVIFKYLPRSWLVMKGLVNDSLVRGREEGDDDDDEVIEDTNRTERAARLRKRREEANIMLQNQRVKREGTIKEEVVDRPTESIDLTPDGEYVPPSRKIGDTIVLEDDGESSTCD